MKVHKQSHRQKRGEDRRNNGNSVLGRDELIHKSNSTRSGEGERSHPKKRRKVRAAQNWREDRVVLCSV